jgi:hypothetical protein
VAVTDREVAVSVNCEFTLICDSEAEADTSDAEDADEDPPDEVRVYAESSVVLAVEEDRGSDEEEDEIADAEVILDAEEEILVLLAADDAALDEAEVEPEAAAPAGGNL